jgi:uncharacterized protein
MRWRGQRGSENVEDRRRTGGRGMAIGGVGGIAGIVVVLLVLLMGQDPSSLLTTAPPSDLTQQQENELAKFSSVVLADTEAVWNAEFRSMNRAYDDPKLVLYSGYVETACGNASSDVGPFYCSGDQTVYIDVEFFAQLGDRFGAPGDFAQAYIIAHEVGHHVQQQLGILDAVHTKMQRTSQEQANALSVRLELQADFLAGIWAHFADESLGVVEPGDVEEALQAASAVGDDTLQKKMQGYVVPDSFTHGTSAQRMKWFKLGYVTGELKRGDTFNTLDL